MTTSSRVRADSATQAIGHHDSNSTKMMDDFDKRNQVLDDTSLALVEAANAIGDDSYRRQTVAIADSARRLEHTFDALRKNYAGTYAMQMALLTAIVKEDGDLRRVMKVMPESTSEKERLGSEADKLRTNEQTSLQNLQEQYSDFKAMTGVTLDYHEPPATAQPPGQAQ